MDYREMNSFYFETSIIRQLLPKHSDFHSNGSPVCELTTIKCAFLLQRIAILSLQITKKSTVETTSLRDSNILSEVAQLPLCIEIIHFDKFKQESRLFKIFTFYHLSD